MSREGPIEASDRLTNAKGEAVSDPFGGTIEVYRKTRDEITTHLRERLAEILALGG